MRYTAKINLYFYCIKINILGHLGGCITNSRLLTWNHRLHIETGAWKRPKVLKERRLCLTCNALENETHFLFECPLYSTLREHYFKNIEWTTRDVNGLYDLINGKNKRSLYNLAHYIDKALYLHHVLNN